MKKFVSLLFVLLLSGLAWPVAEYGQLSGVVTDDQGNPLPGASVTIESGAPMKKVNPDFPPIARMKKITGKVTLKVLVSEKGKPEQVEVVTISPSSATNVGFDKAAVEAVKKWEFQPATKDGIRVKCWFLVPVVFD